MNKRAHCLVPSKGVYGHVVLGSHRTQLQLSQYAGGRWARLIGWHKFQYNN